MKHLKHKYKYNGYNYLTGYDYCIYCDKFVDNLYSSFKSSIKKKYVNKFIKDVISSDINYQEHCDFFDKYAPCLTEEEYIIKNIIE